MNHLVIAVNINGADGMVRGRIFGCVSAVGGGAEDREGCGFLGLDRYDIHRDWA